jgi:glycosyltransferase involved in cell wall biosynthesis
LELKLTMPKVVHLSSVHSPFDNRIFHKECRTLAEAGYEVVFVARQEPDGPMYKGVRLLPVPKPETRLARWRRTVWQVFKAALKENADCYHFHDTELVPFGIMLKLLGKRVIYDVHEEMPYEILSKYYIPTAILRRALAWSVGISEYLSALLFDGIVVANPITARRFPKNKTVLIRNFPGTDELLSGEPTRYASRPNNVAYLGSITAIRGIKEMVQAMSLLPGTMDAKLLLAGRFSPPELETEIRGVTGWNRVSFLGWQHRDGVKRALDASKIGLVLLHPTPFHILSYPWKMFEYMSAGIPIVASDFPGLREVVTEVDCGILVDPLDLNAITEAIAWLLTHPGDAERMGRNGLAAVRQKYNWTLQGQNLKAFYAGLLSGKRPVSCEHQAASSFFDEKGKPV